MTTATKPAPRPVSPAQRARRDLKNSDRLPVIVGVVSTILVHVLIILLGKYIKVMPTPPLKLADGDVTVKEQELNFTLSPDEPRLPPEFVEVNPDAPDAEPDKTNQTGARNQKVAQPDPGKDETEKPKTEGELKQSSAIVSGQRAQPVDTPPPGGGAQGQNDAAMTASVTGDSKVKQAQTPLPGFEDVVGDNPDGIGTRMGDDPNDAKKEVEKKVDGQKESGETGQPQVAVNASGTPAMTPGRPGPRPRPKLPNARSAVLADQPLSTSNLGAIRGVNSRISGYGQYMDKLIEAVEVQWNRVLDQTKARPPSGSQVRVKFRLGKDGQIWEILEVVEGMDKPSTYACLDAIRTPAPYEPWPDDMVAIFGDHDDITFTFYYR